MKESQRLYDNAQESISLANEELSEAQEKLRSHAPTDAGTRILALASMAQANAALAVAEAILSAIAHTNEYAADTEELLNKGTCANTQSTSQDIAPWHRR